ncbi:hypothetical protein HON36_03370 [Candidatus Parcubacteria bacterium]|jgi:superfamily I DNA and/or RNA helicase|nr:hypothetical protein [Candidatus Parcubacteria bacterium]
MTKKDLNQKIEKPAGGFVKEVAKYFMNFLETDFKKRRLPKRNVIQKTQKGLVVGIDLEKYPKLKKDFFKIFNDGFKNNELNITKGKYTNTVPHNLLKLIKDEIKVISKKELNVVFNEIEKMIERNNSIYHKEYDKFLEESIVETKNIFSRSLIIGLLDELDKPLENLNIADENSKFQLEVDVVDSVFSIFEGVYSDFLQVCFQKKKELNIKKELNKIIHLDDIKDNLINFFEKFAIADAFFDIYQLYRNNQLVDKTELYLYFYELSLGNEKFPVFYVPISLFKQEKKITCQFENKVYINTKAIDFVVQEFNLQTDKQASLRGEFDRILYTNNGEENFYLVLENIVRKIENFFEFNKNIDLKEAKLQKGMNLITSFSNKSYLYLFDKSDESLINDYEEILNNDGDIIDNFSALLNGFIEKNPQNFEEEVNDDWHEKSTSNKLVFESPIPLNDEQKKVLIALQKKDCNFMILEGPPGTGKSHTITAIICKALLEEKSVLVLSDKKEALDVVESKISETLNKIRHEDDFQNPILRLGKTGNKFYKIVQGQTINKIKEHYNAYKFKKEEYDNNRDVVLKKLEKNINENINYFKDINIDDIKFYFKNFNRLSKINWFGNYKTITIDLLKIKNVLKKISKNKNNFQVSRDILIEKNYKLLVEYNDSLVNLKGLKESFKQKYNYINISELLGVFDERGPYEQSVLDNLIDIKDVSINLHHLCEDNVIISEIFKDKKFTNIIDLRWRREVLNTSFKLFDEAKKFLGENFYDYQLLSNFEISNDQDITEAIGILQKYAQKLNDLKLPILGYVFKNKEIAILNREFKKTFNYFSIEKPQKHAEDIQDIADLYEFLFTKISENYLTNIESGQLAFKLLINYLTYLEQEKDCLKTYSDIQKQQELLLKINNKLEELEPSLIGEINIIEEIDKITWNIDIFEEIDKINSITQRLSGIIPKEFLFIKNTKCNDYFDVKRISSVKKYITDVEKLIKYEQDIDFIVDIKNNYKDFTERIKLNIDINKVNNASSDLFNFSDEEIKEYTQFKKLEENLEKIFNEQPQDLYSDNIVELEDLTTARMTYFLDERIIKYTQNFASEVGTLKNIISKKQRFPKELFKNLKKAFPCMLAGIRDYAEFIPLEKNLFDLIIIDEASQVSIAQALPALVRGKQVIILGDDKQFSNVKANNASKVTNQELRKKVQKAFVDSKGGNLDDKGWETKVKENFDIKNSILKFTKFIFNYECQLRKHFRCYPEIISYSDKFFYGNNLQCMKIRGKSIEDVIKFDVIKHDGKFDENKNTNELEINFIIDKLKEFNKKNIVQSIGIITPHREQVTLLFDRINGMSERDWLFGQCKLKIMTFDTCQGEERDYIFYSMVATKEKDRLNWIFLKDFSSIKEENDGTIKSQRMNVGFSRAKECMHFVLSKPIEEFNGEIKNAMIHYKNELESGKKRIIKKLDSKMEYKVEEIFYNTKFYKDNKDNIEFIPQFEIGKYLKQLNKDYNHPNYKVDFLLIFNNLKIVIEYDGFKEHFINIDEVDESNYQYYMKEDDIYRQKVLEGYGYKFLRINRFNIGENPIEILNNRLENLVKKKLKIA